MAQRHLRVSEQKCLDFVGTARDDRTVGRIRVISPVDSFGHGVKVGITNRANTRAHTPGYRSAYLNWGTAFPYLL